MSWREDYCPDMGACECGQPLCSECQGARDPHECLGGIEFHCGACVADCPLCVAAFEGESA